TLLVSGQYTGSNALSEAITDNGSVVVAQGSNVAFTGPISGAGAFMVQNSANVTVAGNVTGSEAFTFENNSNTTITGNVTGSESFLVENSAHAVISGSINATGSTGSISLANSAFLELGAADNENVIFAPSSSATLKLDHSNLFAGSVSG